MQCPTASTITTPSVGCTVTPQPLAVLDLPSACVALARLPLPARASFRVAALVLEIIAESSDSIPKPLE